MTVYQVVSVSAWPNDASVPAKQFPPNIPKNNIQWDDGGGPRERALIGSLVHFLLLRLDITSEKGTSFSAALANQVFIKSISFCNVGSTVASAAATILLTSKAVSLTGDITDSWSALGQFEPMSCILNEFGDTLSVTVYQNYRMRRCFYQNGI